LSDLRLIAIPGSLRKASFNRGLLVAAQEMLSGRAEVELISLADIPLYNDDLRLEGYPEPVLRLRDAIDWASRQPGPPLGGKPYGLLGASPGGFGTVRSQLALRQTLLFVQALGYPASLHVSGAAKLFDEEGRLIDEKTRQDLSGYLDGFLAFLERIGAGA
jgi:chromate reductase